MTRKSKHTAWRFVVSGNGQFPLDMLRYDRCFPVHGEDAHKMDARTEWREITLEHRHEEPTAQWKPTVARWRSFGWNVPTTTAEGSNVWPAVER